MAKKRMTNEAAARLRAAKVPTKERTFTAASIAAAAAALVAPHPSPQATKENSAGVASPKRAMVTTSKKVGSPISCTASVMTIGAKSIEEQMTEMRMMMEQLARDNENKIKQIEELQREVSHLRKGKAKVDEVEDVDEVRDVDDDDTTIQGEEAKGDGVLYNEKQLQQMIANVVKTQLNGTSSSGLRYTKPYTRRIDNLRMPFGYQPPKFQQFDGKGNPKQHIAHFIETCNNAGTEGDLLVKQFVRSLKGIAFDWYTDLEPESIDRWDHMKEEFLNRFYSTRRIVA